MSRPSYSTEGDPYARSIEAGDLAAEVLRRELAAARLDNDRLVDFPAGREGVLAEVRARLASSEASAAQMRLALEAWQAWCEVDGDSLTLRDRATEQLGDALANNAVGAGLLAELVQLRAVKGAAVEAMEQALHALETLHGLFACDGFDAYHDALRDGCDNAGAWDVFVEDMISLDTEQECATLRAALAALQPPAPPTLLQPGQPDPRD